MCLKILDMYTILYIYVQVFFLRGQGDSTCYPLGRSPSPARTSPCLRSPALGVPGAEDHEKLHPGRRLSWPVRSLHPLRPRTLSVDMSWGSFLRECVFVLARKGFTNESSARPVGHLPFLSRTSGFIPIAIPLAIKSKGSKPIPQGASSKAMCDVIS